MLRAVSIRSRRVRSSLLHEGDPKRAEGTFGVELSCVSCRDHDTESRRSGAGPCLRQAHSVGTQCAVRRGLTIPYPCVCTSQKPRSHLNLLAIGRVSTAPDCPTNLRLGTYGRRVQIETAPHRRSGAANSAGISEMPRKTSTDSTESKSHEASPSVMGSVRPGRSIRRPSTNQPK
jgi:hypothetical protein